MPLTEVISRKHDSIRICECKNRGTSDEWLSFHMGQQSLFLLPNDALRMPSGLHTVVHGDRPRLGMVRERDMGIKRCVSG